MMFELAKVSYFCLSWLLHLMVLLVQLVLISSGISKQVELILDGPRCVTQLVDH